MLGSQVSARHWTSAQTFWSTLLLILTTTTYLAIFTIYPIYNQLPCFKCAFWKKITLTKKTTGSVSSVRHWSVISVLWSVFPSLYLVAQLDHYIVMCSHVPNILGNSDPSLSPSIFYVVDQNLFCKSLCRWHQSKVEFANVCSNIGQRELFGSLQIMIEMIKANNWLRNVNRPSMIEMKDKIYRSRSLDFQKSEVRRKTRQFPIWQSNLTSE